MGRKKIGYAAVGRALGTVICHRTHSCEWRTLEQLETLLNKEYDFDSNTSCRFTLDILKAALKFYGPGGCTVDVAFTIPTEGPDGGVSRDILVATARKDGALGTKVPVVAYFYQGRYEVPSVSNSSVSLSGAACELSLDDKAQMAKELAKIIQARAAVSATAKKRPSVPNTAATSSNGAAASTPVPGASNAPRVSPEEATSATTAAASAAAAADRSTAADGSVSREEGVAGAASSQAPPVSSGMSSSAVTSAALAASATSAELPPVVVPPAAAPTEGSPAVTVPEISDSTQVVFSIGGETRMLLASELPEGYLETIYSISAPVDTGEDSRDDEADKDREERVEEEANEEADEEAARTETGAASPAKKKRKYTYKERQDFDGKGASKKQMVNVYDAMEYLTEKADPDEVMQRPFSSTALTSI